MFKNSYQYGKLVPLLNIQSKMTRISTPIFTIPKPNTPNTPTLSFPCIDKDSLSGWSFNGPVKKAYDKTCKGFIMLFEHNTKAQLPADPRNQEDLHLVQPYLLL
jgi:hypothetical protein